MADCKRKTANLFDGTLDNGYYANTDFNLIGAGDIFKSFKIYLVAGTYTIKWGIPVRAVREVNNGIMTQNPFDNSDIWSFRVNSDGYFGISFRNLMSTQWDNSVTIMLNSGNTAIPYEPYWVHSLRKLTTATEAVENPLYSDGTAITSYTIKGNTVQNGTPTPDNPVDVVGVGVRTENTIDWDTWINSIDSINGGGSYTATATSISITSGTSTDAFTSPYGAGNPSTYRMAVKPNTTYSVSIDGTGSYQLILWKNGIAASGYGQYFNPARKFATITTDSETTFYTFRAANVGSLGSTATLSNVTIIEGEYTAQTMPTYEPYGYKIPISNGQQTTNIYLGSTQTTRQIKNLVLDGTEDWESDTAAGGALRFYLQLENAQPSDLTIGAKSICTHFPLTITGNTYNQDNSYTIASNMKLYFRKEADTTLDRWKQWLADQYSAGTPVTLWYVLTTPETGIVNEPLQKIGTYADTLSNAAQIPTTEGANSITVGTTVQPSEFTATWTGWHDSSVKEWNGSQWNE